MAASEQDSSQVKNDCSEEGFHTRGRLLRRIGIPLLSSRPRVNRPFGHVCMWQIEFPSAVEANLICAAFNREHTTHVTVLAAKENLKYPQE